MSGFVRDSAAVARMEEAAEWLQRLHSSPEDEALAAAWFDWCQAHPDNLQAFERMQKIWQAFDAPAARTASRRRPLDVVGPHGAPHGRRYRARRILVGGSIAAGLAVIAAFIGWRTADILQPAKLLTTDVAEHGSQLLADGSRVDLGARTRIATRYTSNQRTVIMESGEAFFKVARDAARPFVVQAGAVRVTALGTAFSVRRTLDRTVVTVSEGLVSIAPFGAAKPPKKELGHEVHAGAGERVIFSAAENRLSVANIDPRFATAWRDGVLKFVDEPLASVIDDVNRYAPRPIAIEDSRLRERLYTGTVYRDRIEEWLHALERVFPLQVIEERTGSVILAPK